MANLTIAFDAALLQRGREAALREKTSVNALVRDSLPRYVEARSQRLEALASFEVVAATSQGIRHQPWSQESLYERPRCGCSWIPTSGQ